MEPPGRRPLLLLLLVLLPLPVLVLALVGTLPQLAAANIGAAAQPSAPGAAVEQIEFLDGPASKSGEAGDGGGGDAAGPYVIKTNAFWTEKNLSMSIRAEDGVSAETLAAAREFVAGSSNNNILNNTATTANATRSTVSEWDLLLSEFSGSAPMLSLSAADSDGSANIRITLTAADHPEGKLGKTRLFAIKGEGKILSAEITIYSAERMLGQGMLEYAVAHELGHALGLSHSTDPASIMYSVLEMEDGRVVNDIDSCETSGISSLYVESKIGIAEC